MPENILKLFVKDEQVAEYQTQVDEAFGEGKFETLFTKLEDDDEKGNRWKLNIDDSERTQKMGSLLQANKKFEDEIKKYNDKSKSLGEDPFLHIEGLNKQIEKLKETQDETAKFNQDQIDEKVQSELKRYKSDYELKSKNFNQEISKRDLTITELNLYKNSVEIENRIRGSINRYPLHETSHDMIMKYAKNDWVLNDNNDLELSNNFKGKRFSDTDPNKTISMDEYMEQIIHQHPFLTAPSDGGGASGSTESNVSRSTSSVDSTNFSDLETIRKIRSGEIKVGLDQIRN